MKKVYWLGSDTQTCQTCDTPITNTFYDMKTVMGPWANMCPSCATLGPGINRTGTGFGQKYEKQSDGKWLKTEG